MWAAVLAFVAKLLGVLLEPRNASATHEARDAGAAERELKVIEISMARVDRSVDARDAARRIEPGDDGVMPDDGFRRD